jgi:hypothetical protein
MGNVHACIHVHQNVYPQSTKWCPSKNAKTCWFSTLIAVKSKDGGKKFTRMLSADNPNGVIASAPIQYQPDAGVQGVPAHRHIVKHPSDGYFYVMPECAYLKQMNISGPGRWA